MSYKINRLGQINQSGMDVTEMFYKIFSGQVFLSYEKAAKTEGIFPVRKITAGKSTGFNYLGGFTASLLTPGDELTGTGSNLAEKVVSIDGLLTAHTIIHDIDEAMNHFEVRSKFAEKLGRALAIAKDTNMFLEMLKGANASAILSDGYGGGNVTSDKFKIASGGASSKTEMVDNLIAAFETAAQNFDEKNVPEEGRKAWLRPSHYRALVSGITSDGFSAIHKDLGGSGDIASGKIYQLHGIDIMMSNNIPSTNVSTGNHAVDASQLVGLFTGEEAVGSVELMAMGTEIARDHRLQAWYIIETLAAGFGFLRPESCFALKLDSLSN